MQTNNLIRAVDLKFKEFISYGKNSLVVFRNVPYQMFNYRYGFYLVEIPGFFGDDTKKCDVSAINVVDKLPEKLPKLRKKIYIKKSDIISAEICGNVKDYFVLVCGNITFSIRKKFGVKKMTFELPGEVNQFVVRDFLDGIENIVIKNSDGGDVHSSIFGPDRNEHTTIGALIKFFNKKGRAINIINWILAILSIVLVFAGSSPYNEYGNLIKGIAAVLPLVIYIIYLKYNGLLRFISFGGRAKSPYEKSHAECFIKITLPMIFVLLSETYQFKVICSMYEYANLSLLIALCMVILFAVFTYGWRLRKMTLFVCIAMCIFYSFAAVNAVNMAFGGELVETYNEEIIYKGVRQNSSGADVYYYVVWIENSRYEFIVDKEEYDSLIYQEPYSMTIGKNDFVSYSDFIERYLSTSEVQTSEVTVKKYKGLLGLCYIEPEIGE